MYEGHAPRGACELKCLSVQKLSQEKNVTPREGRVS